MFDIGTWEVLIIIFFGLMIFGPEKIPSIARTLARFVRTIKTTSEDLRDAFQKEINQMEDKKGDSEKSDIPLPKLKKPTALQENIIKAFKEMSNEIEGKPSETEESGTSNKAGSSDEEKKSSD